jgi:hypothetical protein
MYANSARGVFIDARGSGSGMSPPLRGGGPIVDNVADDAAKAEAGAAAIC